MTPTRRPDDLAAPRLSPDDCFIWGEESESGIQANRHRATAISNYANEYGCRFQDVACRRRFMRMLTRQESYNHRVDDLSDAAAWDWADRNGYVYRDGEYRDEAGHVYEPPPFDETVPAGWEPDEDDPVWEFCERGTPGAIPCWHLEARV